MNSEMFIDIYGYSPTVRVFSPAYLELIGEHIADHGYGMIALANDTGTEILAAINGKSEIRLINTDDNYRPCSLSLPSKWAGTTSPEWFDYLLAGWNAAVERLKIEAIGFDILVEGSIPAGLSNISSMICAAALATWAIYTGQGLEKICREELANICASAEWFIGKRGEKAVYLTQLLGSEDMALRLDYFPLRSRLVNIPHIAVFDVLNSGEEAKASSLRQQRLAEGKIAGKLLLKNAGKTCSSLRLKDVQETLGKTLEEMIELCNSLPEKMNRDELMKLFDMPDLNEWTAEVNYLVSFKLRSTARHVFSEALRVDTFERACEARDLFTMGRIFNECHDSCSKAYECSTKAVDNVVTKCRIAGAYGAHVSGWTGNTVVALIDDFRPVFLGDNLICHAFSSSGISIEFL
ncbi:hypothetical protein KIN20_004050 [Parelaphostrongylus tenuis]|uniref:Galactokinase n=1 Tax=Parelaphostrongylus tenuis TaxID=148309 RepID=A0AAD5M028_PARTN|nr:hypothetical protein KIN20_004050 [Parelaphostrongylus tenuis]